MQNRIEKTLSSLEVAEMISKDHKNLLRDIKRYCNQLGQLNFELTEFFQESSYKTEQNKIMPCYQITKKGCEFIAHKLTGVKGTEFTAKYINKFHDMEKIIKNTIIPTTIPTIEMPVKRILREDITKEQVYLKLLSVETLLRECKEVLTNESIINKPNIPLSSSMRVTYTATELGEYFGVNRQKITSITYANNLINKKYGEFHYRSNVPTFVYYNSVIPEIANILNKERR